MVDIELRLRRNPSYREKILRQCRVLDEIDSKAKGNGKWVDRYNQELRKLLRLCHFNLAFLSSYYFPQFPRDEPLTFEDYPFTYHMFTSYIGGFTVIRGSRQISKSTALSCRQLLHAQFYHGLTSLYICPRGEQLRTYANKLRDAEQASLFRRTDTLYRRNLHYKEFSKNSKIELLYVLTNPSNARGKSGDEIVWDEYQDFDPDLEPEMAEIQSASNMPMSVYAGTSLTTDTALEKKFNDSSGCFWGMRCGCGYWNFPLPEYGVMDMIQPKGPSCVKCGRLLQVRLGQFIVTDHERDAIGHYGFHIPQIIVPSVVNHQFRWDEVVKKKDRYDYRKFYQEILGIPTEEGEREITTQDLKNICVLGSDTGKLAAKARKGDYKWVLSGCDWGGSDYNPQRNIKISTTVHVIIGITPDNYLDILHFNRFHGMNYDEIADIIIRDHRRFHGDGFGTDFGAGAWYNAKIREHTHPSRHFVFDYTGPRQPLITMPKNPAMINLWNLNKSESLSMTFDATRRGRIRCFDWSLAEPYLSDFLNVYRAPGEKSSSQGSGASTFLYMGSPSKPNDALMAVNYAHMLARVVLKEPMFADYSMQMTAERIMQSGFSPANYGPGVYSG